MKVFLDANVIFSACKSSSGASNAIFRLKNKLNIALVSSKLAVEETERNLREKKDAKTLKKFNKLLKMINIVEVDSDKAKYVYKTVIEEKDAPILYGAKIANVDYLLTLDKRHFFTEKLKNEKLPFKIMRPGEFLQEIIS